MQLDIEVSPHAMRVLPFSSSSGLACHGQIDGKRGIQETMHPSQPCTGGLRKL